MNDRTNWLNICRGRIVHGLCFSRVNVSPVRSIRIASHFIIGYANIKFSNGDTVYGEWMINCAGNCVADLNRYVLVNLKTIFN